MKLKDAVAIITGGGSGLGKAIADRICQEGGNALLVDIDHQAGLHTCKQLQELYGSGCAVFIRFDVTDMHGYSYLFERCEQEFKQPVNLLINNAGITGEPTFFDPDLPTHWRRVIDIDLTAVVRGTQVGLGKMQQNGGVIINVSSVAGLMPVKFAPVYAAA